jgi:NAD(P)H-hydrate repair Nnr-like enzyme with NAD(P)H-hydrate dehydratase domain
VAGNAKTAAPLYAEVLKISALAAYLHGKAGDTLSEEYSDFGVTPSDLPKAMAKELAKICKLK